MDASLLASAGVSSSSIVILYILYRVFIIIKGKKVVSNCCGKKLEVGVDVRDMAITPTDPPEKRRDSLVEPHSVSASRSRHESESEDVENQRESKKNISDHTHHHQKDVEGKNAHESSGLTIFVPKQHHTEITVRTPPIPSWPQNELAVISPS